jgi:cytoskeletal protein RodZ
MSAHAGQSLKSTRESKGITLQKAAEDLCLRADVLRELEDTPDATSLPETYRKLSLRMYARYLEVDFTSTGDKSGVKLSPVDGCVELAYSDRLDEEEKPKKKRRVFGFGTIVLAAGIMLLGTGLWSLNATLARLNFDERPPRQAVAAAAPAPSPVEVVVPTKPDVTLDDDVFLTLSPSLNEPAVETAVTAP